MALISGTARILSHQREFLHAESASQKISIQMSTLIDLFR
jgi:hypothetical protein